MGSQEYFKKTRSGYEQCLSVIILCIYDVTIEMNEDKMELLQSQAPVDLELSGSSASARHGTFDIGHQTSDMRHGTQEFGNIEGLVMFGVVW